MALNKLGPVLLGGSALGLLYLGSAGTQEGEQAMFGGSGGGGGFFAGQDSNYTDVSKKSSDSASSDSTVQDAIASFLGPIQTSSSTSVSGDTKKTYAPASTDFGVGFFDEKGTMVGGYDNNALMSFVGPQAPSSFLGPTSKKQSIPAGAIGQNVDGSFIFGNTSASAPKVASSGGSSSKSSAPKLKSKKGYKTSSGGQIQSSGRSSMKITIRNKKSGKIVDKNY